MVPEHATRSLTFPGAGGRRIPETGILNCAGTEANEVRIRLSLFDVTEINVPMHRFVADFAVEITWIDCSLAYKDVASLEDPELWEPQFPSRTTKSAQYWSPRLNFYNVIDIAERTESLRVFKESRDGRSELPAPVVCYRLKGQATFRKRFRLESFPFDTQNLDFNIVSSIPTAAMVGGAAVGNLRWGEDEEPYFVLMMNRSKSYMSVVPHNHFLLQGEYSMGSIVHESLWLTDVADSYSGYQYPALTLWVQVGRKPGFYMWNTVLPMFLLVALGFPCLLADELQDRLSGVYTLLLAAFTYKSWIGDNLPKVSYLTALDKYVFTCILCLAALAGESTLVYALKNMSICDRFCKWEGVIIQCGFYAWTFGHVYLWTWGKEALRARDLSRVKSRAMGAPTSTTWECDHHAGMSMRVAPVAGTKHDFDGQGAFERSHKKLRLD